MVYYFTSNVVEPAGFIYVGKDKFESEFSLSAEVFPHLLRRKLMIWIAGL